MNYLLNRFCLALGLLLAMAAPDASAQGAAPWSCPLPANTPSGTRDSCFQWFSRGAGFANYTIRAMVEQVDGRILLGGDFSSFDGFKSPMLCRIYPDGRIDSSFVSGLRDMDSHLSSVHILPSGKFLVTGYQLEDSNGTAIFRLNANGSLDPSFRAQAVGAVQHGAGYLPNGRILVSKSLPDGRVELTRLDENGEVDNTFTPFRYDSLQFITSIAVLPAGKVLVVGVYRANSRGAIFRLNADGRLDGTFQYRSDIRGLSGYASRPGSSGVIDGLGNGKLLFSGRFTSIGAKTFSEGPHAVIFNADGTLDAAFTEEGNLDYSQRQFMPNGSFIIGSYVPAISYGFRLALYNADASLDTVMSVGTPNGYPFRNQSEYVLHSILKKQDGRYLFAGFFVKVNELSRRALFQASANGQFDEEFAPDHVGFNQGISHAEVSADGRILATFNAGYGVAYYRNKLIPWNLCRLHPDGTLDTSFRVTLPDSGYRVGYFHILRNQKILVMCRKTIGFLTLGTKLIRLNPDGSLDPTFHYRPPNNGFFGNIMEGLDGKLLCIVSVNPYLTRLNVNGTPDQTFNDNVQSLGITNILNRPGGGYYVSTYYGGGSWPTTSVRTLSQGGVLGASLVTESWPHMKVGLAGVQADGRVITYSANDFTCSYGICGGVTGLARYKPSGTQDTTFRFNRTGWSSGARQYYVPFGNLSELIFEPDGKFIYSAGGTISWVFPDGRVDTTLNVREGLDDNAELRLMPDGKLLVYGEFTKYKKDEVGFLMKIFVNDCSLPAPGFTQNINTLTATGTRPRGAYYQWYRNGFTLGGPDSTKNTLAITDSGRYSVALLKGTCRNESADVLLMPISKPDASIRVRNAAAAALVRLCANDTLLLEARPARADYKYRWYKDGALLPGDTAPALRVDTIGRYAVEVLAHPAISDTSQAIRVVMDSLPATYLIRNITGADTICSGTAQLLAPLVIPNQSATYYWYIDSVPQPSLTGQRNITVSQSGVYRCRVQSTSPCSVWSQPVALQFASALPQPVISGPTSVSFCMGDSARLFPGTTVAQPHQWLRNDTLYAVTYQPTPRLVVRQSGLYKLRFAIGPCRKTSSGVSLTAKPLPAISLALTPDVVLRTQESTGLALQRYDWFKNGNRMTAFTADTLNPRQTGSGLYWVQALGTNGCLSPMSDTVRVQITGLTNRNTGASLRVMPNPSSGRVRVASRGRGRLQVLNVQGKQVYSAWKPSDDDAFIDLQHLQKGLYILRLGAEQGLVVRE